MMRESLIINSLSSINVVLRFKRYTLDMSKKNKLPNVLVRLVKNAEVLTFAFIEKIGDDKYQYIEVVPHIDAAPVLPMTTEQLSGVKIKSCRFEDVAEVTRDFIKKDSTFFFKRDVALSLAFQVKRLYVERYGNINAVWYLNELP